jgi:hypothetical protein
MATCQHCGYQSEDLEMCPLCSTQVKKERNRPGIKECFAGPSWEDETEAFPQKFIDTWRRSMLEPTLFFRGVTHKEQVASAVLYFVIIIIGTALFDLCWKLLLPVPEASSVVRGMFTWRGIELLPQTDQPPAFAVLNFFLAPFAATFGLLLWSGLLHLPLRVFHKERQSLKTTLRIVSYAAGPSVLAVIPIVGSIVGGVWSLVLTVIGIREAHRMSTRKALLCVLLATAVPICIAILAITIMVAAVASVIT